MDSYIYIILVGFTILFVIYLLIKKRNKTLNKKIDQSQFEKKELSIEKKRYLAFGAILAYYKRERILSIEHSKNLSYYSQGLENQWNIINQETAKDKLNNLLNLHKSSQLDLLLGQPSNTLDKIQLIISKELDISLNEVKAVQSSYAWDICRLINLAKWCLWCGYITDREMWSYIIQGSEKANQLGKSWEEYTISFLLGRTLQGFDIDEIGVECMQLYHSRSPKFRNMPNIDVYKTNSFKV